MKKILFLLLFLQVNVVFGQRKLKNCTNISIIGDTTICTKNIDENKKLHIYYVNEKAVRYKEIILEDEFTYIKVSSDLDFEDYEFFKFHNDILVQYTKIKDLEPDGLFLCFSDDGKKSSVSNYVKGKLDGHTILFRPDGKLYSDEIYKKDKKNGEARMYDDDGTLAIKTNYLNDKKDGVENIFYPNGLLKISFEYKKGKLMNVIECLNQTGQKMDYGTLKNGNGLFYIYGFDEKIKTTYKVKNGKKTELVKK